MDRAPLNHLSWATLVAGASVLGACGEGEAKRALTSNGEGLGHLPVQVDATQCESHVASSPEELCRRIRGPEEPSECHFQEPLAQSEASSLRLVEVEEVEADAGGAKRATYAVLEAAGDLQIAASVSEFFPEARWHAKRAQLSVRPGDTQFVIDVEVSRFPEMECLRATETIDARLTCGEIDSRFFCVRADVQRRLEARIAGNVHPLASVYDYQSADACQATLDEHGLTVEKDSVVIDESKRPVDVRLHHSVRYGGVGGSVEVPIRDFLATGSCVGA